MPTLTPSSEDTRVYELTVLIPYPMNQKEEATLLKDIQGLLDEAGATIIDQDIWGRRGLAYTISGYDEGNYIVYYLDMDPAKLKEFDEALRIQSGVLRHLIIKPPKGYQIVKYSEEYETWLKERESVEDVRKREKEEALQKRVAEKAKRQAKRAAKEKAEAKTEEKAAPVQTEKLEEELEKIISDDELDL